MELVLATMLGLGLSAACGFRVFVPLLILSLGVNAGWVSAGEGWHWIGETAALVTLGIATTLEIGAYYIPVIDNFLDTLATPAAVVAGTVATASMVADLDPLLQWSVALIGGGGLAGGVQAGTTVVRAASTVGTAGLANPVFSTFETISAAVLSLMAILVPIFAAIAVLFGIAVIALALKKRRAASNRRLT